MKQIAFAAFALCLGISAAAAQMAPVTPGGQPIPAAPAPAGSGPATNGTPPAPGAAAAAPTGKEVRQQCRDAAIAKGLRGDARKTDVKDCFAKARPDLAAANQCREEGKAKGLADKELKAFVKQCKTGAQ